MPIAASMRITRSAVLLTLLSLTACGSEAKPAGTPVEEPAAPSSDFALPVTAPMKARERMLQDLEQRNNAARQRGDQFETTLEQKR